MSASGTPEDYELGLRLAEARSTVAPEDRARRVLVPIALFRLGRYAKALSLLKNWQREWERAVIRLVGQTFILGWRTLLLDDRHGYPHVTDDVAKAMAFLAMTHHHLGHTNRARACLADFKRMGNDDPSPTGNRSQNPGYIALRREAETLIEGLPQPGK